MNEKNTQVIIDALVDQIKSLKLTILVRDTEIAQLKERLNKEKGEG